MIKFRLTLFVILLFCTGIFTNCARVSTLNLQRHVFAEPPTKIIWLQVAGLSDEHLPLIKFSADSSDSSISFEKSACIGKMWSYNLYSLRPDANANFLTQISGSKNHKEGCSDFDFPPFWKSLGKSGALAGILENGVDEGKGLDAAFQCHNEKNYYTDLTIVWKMAKSKNTNAAFFSGPSNVPLTAGVYFDKSCQQENCHSGLFENVKLTFEFFSKRPFANVYIVRDFKYAEMIQNGEILKAREYLLEIDKIYNYFLDFQKSNSNTLILFSTTAARQFEFPQQGTQWSDFDKKGKNVVFRQASLMSSIYASGAMAENFCGIYEEAQVRNRILFVPGPINVLEMFGF